MTLPNLAILNAAVPTNLNATFQQHPLAQPL